MYFAFFDSNNNINIVIYTAPQIYLYINNVELKNK